MLKRDEGRIEYHKNMSWHLIFILCPRLKIRLDCQLSLEYHKYTMSEIDFLSLQKKIMNSVFLQFPGSIYAMETRNPGPMYANKFFQLLLCKIEA